MGLNRDDLQAFLATAFPHVPAGRYVVEEASASGVRLRLTAGERDTRPGGTLLGPTLMELADVAAYATVLAGLGAVALAVTTSLTIHFLRKPPVHDVIAEARPLKRGAKLWVIEARMTTAGEEDPVAHATVTYALPSKASGA
jgi:uncharacterized protein (TIGR00369 family)